MSDTSYAISKMAEDLEFQLDSIDSSIQGISSVIKQTNSNLTNINQSLIVLSLPEDVRAEARAYFALKNSVRSYLDLLLLDESNEKYKTWYENEKNKLVEFIGEHPHLRSLGLM